MNRLQSNPILRAEDHHQIQTYFGELPEKEAVKKSADLFIQRRLERADLRMDKSERARARWVFDHADIDWKFLNCDSARLLNATYDSQRERIGVQIHPELDGSIAVYATKVHEIEHHLQNRRLPGEPRACMFGMSVGLTDWELADEGSAMLMEGEFYLAMPLSLRERLVKLYEIKLTSPSAARILTHARIMITAQSREDYVRRMWEADRYNPNTALAPDSGAK